MSARTCVSCGETFLPKNPRRLACSAPCAREKQRVTEARYRERVRNREKEIPAEQECYRCGEMLSASAFHKNRATVSGLQGICKQCRREYDAQPDQQEKGRERKQFWYLLHQEDVNRRRRERLSRDPDYRAEWNAQNLARYYADPRGIIDRRRELRQARRQWEREGARACFCGRALPADSEEGPWFCRPACKAVAIRQILWSGDLGALLWRLKRNSDEQRLSLEDEALIVAIACNTASRWAGKGSAVPKEDLLSAAYLGAWNAWLSYEAAKGAALSTWLIYGARREVLESLRAADPLSRSERRAYREALAENSGAPVPRQILSLEALAYEGLEGEPLSVRDRVLVQEDETPALVERIDTEQAAERILAALKALPPRKAEVVRLIGWEGLSQSEVADLLGISPSRVQQLWQAAKAQIHREIVARETSSLR